MSWKYSCAFCHAARASLLTRGPYAGAMACAQCYEARATDTDVPPGYSVPVTSYIPATTEAR